jgi:hypothetical protein
VNVYDFYITPDEYEAAMANGVGPKLLEIRVRRLAWNKERAIQTPPHEKKSLKDWVEMAENNGICYSTLRYRINRLGWEPERAATQPLQDRSRMAKYASECSRKYAASYQRLAEKNGIPERTYHRRMKDGWDPQVAATRAPMTHSEIGLLTKEKRHFKRLFLKKKGDVANG